MQFESALPTFNPHAGLSIAQASPWHFDAVTLDSPALKVMTDLTQVKAAMVRPDQSLQQAEQAMIYQGVRMLLVVSEMPQLEGLITSTDLSGERPLRLVNERHLRFDELRVADVMTPLARLDAIDFERMRTATVSNLVATLKRFGRNHLVVVEGVAGGATQRVRGVVSRAQIERQLGQPVEVSTIASSFSEIERALA